MSRAEESRRVVVRVNNRWSSMLRHDSLVTRVRGEFYEMPGLCLTCPQASRFWQVDIAFCGVVLEQLVREGFLYKTHNGAYVAASMNRRGV